MIIDLILDRKDGCGYNSRDFYFEICDYENLKMGVANCEISRAMDCGTNKDVQRELCNYVKNNGYNEAICDYINSQIWVED